MINDYLFKITCYLWFNNLQLTLYIDPVKKLNASKIL